MTASRFFADAFRAAAYNLNLLLLPLNGTLSATYLAGYKAFGKRERGPASLMLFRIWLPAVAVIPAGFLAALVYAGQHGGWAAFGVFVYALVVLYVVVLAAGVLAGLLDRAGRSVVGPEASRLPASVAFQVPDNLKDILADRIRGQDLALEEISNAVITSARNYTHGKSLGMYLLVGATGSGKTETAKQLAEALGWPLYREECNQYATQYSITRLIGAAAGYKDAEQGGSLTNALRSSRHGILLLDEIEKAHVSVSRTLMTLADEGFITTGLGEVIDARGWLILATSNASQAEIVKIVEQPKMRSFERIAAVKRALAEHWSPEIIARMRSVVPYKPVDATAMRQVFEDMLLMAFHEAGAGDDHKIHIEDAAIDLLSEAYASLRQYGVREMRSFIDRDLGLPLVRFLESDDLHVVISAEGDKLVAFPEPGGPKRSKVNVKGLMSRIGFGSNN
jgi:MoxR-like ATPase